LTAFPILGILLSRAAIAYFEANGWRVGLIEGLIPIFWLVLVYRILVGLLYTTMSEERAKQYSHRFLLPLAILLGLGLAWRTISGTLPLGDTVLFNLLDTQVVLRTLISALVVLYFFFVSAWIIRDLLRHAMMRREGADVGVTNAVVLTTYYSMMALGVFTAITMLGFNLSTLTVVLGGLSVGLSFGLQDLVANFTSGILLVYERSLRPGDIIQVGGQRGTVDQLRLRSTVLRTIDNVEIFVPNRTLLTSTVETFTHTDRLVRRTVLVGVSYGSQPEQVRDLLLGVAGRHGLILDTPPPMALFTDFGPSSLDFELNFWINDPPRGLQIMSDIRFMIFREFAKHGIEIPFPQNDLHIRSGLFPGSLESSDGFESSRIGAGDRASGSANQALEST
jgi:small-conductance mechanosensitive channel